MGPRSEAVDAALLILVTGCSSIIWTAIRTVCVAPTSGEAHFNWDPQRGPAVITGRYGTATDGVTTTAVRATTAVLRAPNLLSEPEDQCHIYTLPSRRTLCFLLWRSRPLWCSFWPRPLSCFYGRDMLAG